MHDGDVEDKILAERHEEKRLLGRPMRRWKDDIHMDHEALRCEGIIIVCQEELCCALLVV
jgi:hypothetical protein